MFFLRFVVSNFETWLEHVQCAWTTFPNSFFSGPSCVKSQHQRACCAVIVVVRHSGPKMTTPKWFTVQHGVIFYPKTYQPVIWRVPKISVPQTIRFSVENKNCWMILGFSRLKKKNRPSPSPATPNPGEIPATGAMSPRAQHWKIRRPSCLQLFLGQWMIILSESSAYFSHTYSSHTLAYFRSVNV